jgi:hypothetical protein
MPENEVEQPFDSLESAYDFMDVLASTTVDVMTDLSGEYKTALQNGHLRRAQALELAIFKLKTLNCHIHKSRRIFNDLRMIRRVLHSERQVEARAGAA